MHGNTSSVIGQKDQSQNRYYQKTKHVKFSRALFSWNTRFKIRPFTLLPTIFQPQYETKWNFNSLTFLGTFFGRPNWYTGLQNVLAMVSSLPQAGEISEKLPKGGGLNFALLDFVLLQKVLFCDSLLFSILFSLGMESLINYRNQNYRLDFDGVRDNSVYFYEQLINRLINWPRNYD